MTTKPTMTDVLVGHRIGHTIGHAVHCVCDSETGMSPDVFYRHLADALADAGYGDVAAAKAEALREAAEDAETTINAGDIAECAAHVPGETGRSEAVARRDSLHEDPANWLRYRANDIEEQTNNGVYE